MRFVGAVVVLAVAMAFSGCAGGGAGGPTKTVTVTTTVTQGATTPATTTEAVVYAGPAISFTQDEGGDKVTVASAADGADWNRIIARVKSCTVNTSGLVPRMGGTSSPYYNAPATAFGGALTEEQVGSSATACAPANNLKATQASVGIKPNDFLAFCMGTKDKQAAPSGSSMTSIVLEIMDTQQNVLIKSFTFTDFKAC